MTNDVAEARPKEPEEPSELAGKRVFIVEDQAMTVIQLTRILESAGVEVVGAAADGIEAVHRVKQAKPDMVLMDVHIPVMNGVEAARRILDSLPVCVVMLTAYSADEHRDTALELGASAYITKPFTRESLLPQLASAYRSHCANRS